MEDGLTTIEKAREEYKLWYEHNHGLSVRVMLKCWINHSESRYSNGNKPYTYANYEKHMRLTDCIQQIKFNMIDVDDLGGKNNVITLLVSGLT
jgi:hypothetical protein